CLQGDYPADGVAAVETGGAAFEDFQTGKEGWVKEVSAGAALCGAHLHGLAYAIDLQEDAVSADAAYAVGRITGTGVWNVRVGAADIERQADEWFVANEIGGIGNTEALKIAWANGADAYR